eukprot:SAG11_NODE_1765_length_4285_cov_3.009795_5_plen_82_part_00
MAQAAFRRFAARKRYLLSNFHPMAAPEQRGRGRFFSIVEPIVIAQLRDGAGSPRRSQHHHRFAADTSPGLQRCAPVARSTV